MRILLFGKFGQLGWELERTLACLGEVRAIDYPEVDFTHPESLPGIVHEVQPNLIINAIAYTDVDKAESEQEKARKVNATSVGVLAEKAHRLKIPFIHYSTEYVFDGKKGAPYVESDDTHPLNVYGQTKLEGEQAIQDVGGDFLILRTSWVYSLRKGGFVNKVLKWGRTQKTIRIVDDQIGSPTWARMLAEYSAQIVAQSLEDTTSYFARRSGIYHLAGRGMTSRYEWAEKVIRWFLQNFNMNDIDLLPAKSVDFPTPAQRPAYTPLSSGLAERTFSLILPEWSQSLQLALDGSLTEHT